MVNRIKEQYFDSKSIAEKSRIMLQKVEKYRERHKITPNPEHCALLIIDMQRYFLDDDSHAYIPSSPPVIENIKKLSDAFCKIGAQIILTKHSNTHDNANLMSIWWGELINDNNPLSEIIPELHIPGVTVIKKTQYDAFYKTNLEDFLKEKEITQIVVTGVMTHLCCETTARSAFMRGFTVFFPVDGTASYNEEFHQSTILNLSHGFAIPVLCRELIGYREGI